LYAAYSFLRTNQK